MEPGTCGPSYTRLLQRLGDDSPEFARVWRDHEVERFTSRERRFHHPTEGETRYEHHRLTPSDTPGLHVVIHTPAPT